MQDYKDTLNLPKTAFAMKANLAQREPEMLKRWEDINLYQQLREQRQGAKKFILHDGPPYANGHLHIGHAMNKILKDIVVKVKSMSGYDAPYVPGWDCHGLPIEHQVEKKVGKPGVKVDPKTFRQKCREYAQSQIDIQREEFQRLGVIGDWHNPYKTMDYHYEANIIRSLAKLVKNGHLHRGSKPVYWCLDCRSALAEAEVEYADKTSPSIDVAYAVIAPEKLLATFNCNEGEGKLSVPIWTTTPWTLPASMAVTLHPELTYVLVQCTLQEQPHQLVLASELVEQVMTRYDCQQFKVLAQCHGKDLAGQQLQHPFYDRQVPIVLGEHVTIDAGTGAVHTAPAHGLDDYLMALKYNITIENPVDPRGFYIPELPIFGGKHIIRDSAAIIELLTANKVLLNSSTINHSYPHCWRHKSPVIFRATPQWFISMDQNGLRKQALASIAATQWIPDWGQARIAGMVAERPDWCISRQRTWGVPLAFLMHKHSGELHHNTLELMETVAKRVEQNGIEAWHELTVDDLLAEDVEEYEKSDDTLDVWFDSGVSHACVLAQNSELTVPADIYLEGSDQHRGWFNSSLITGVGMRGAAPYKQVLTHGYTVDGQGRKMSKSLGNVIALDKTVKTLGADIIRLWVSATDYRREVNVSEEILKRNADAYRRIRNTARFLLANLHDFDPAKHIVERQQMLALDRWAVDRACLLQKDIMHAFEDYAYHVFYQKLHNFCTVDMGGFYLDVIKDRQYTCQTESLARRSAQTAMYHIIEALVRWLAPVLSFTADEIWQHIPGERSPSVFLATWYEGLFALKDDDVLSRDEWQQVINIRDAVNKELENQRNDGKIRSPLNADVVLFCEPETATLLNKLADEVRFVLITSTAVVSNAEQRDSTVVKTEIPGLWLKVTPSTATKCVRCWHHRDDVGSNADHPEICSRCISNVSGKGEKRLFA